MVSDGPDFETKAADVTGLYLTPPGAHSALFCVDERCRPDVQRATASSTSATDTLSQFAALNTRTGEVMGKTAARHTSEQFVAFLY